LQDCHARRRFSGFTIGEDAVQKPEELRAFSARFVSGADLATDEMIGAMGRESSAEDS
jgi:hypothetical protein